MKTFCHFRNHKVIAIQRRIGEQFTKLSSDKVSAKGLMRPLTWTVGNLSGFRNFREGPKGTKAPHPLPFAGSWVAAS